MSDHHLITGSDAGVPVLACGMPWADGVTSGEPAGASRLLRPLTCPDCAARCPHCATAPGSPHHRDCPHPSAAGNRQAPPAPSGPSFAWQASGPPAAILAAIEAQPEDNPLNTAVQELLVKALGRWHRGGDACQVAVTGSAGGGGPLALTLEIIPEG